MRKIMLVEDNVRHRELLSRRLRGKGYEVVAAEHGGLALDTARRERPDVILMDLRLPVLDGWGATRALKADAATRHIPVIAVSAYDLPEQRRRCVDAGCDDFEPKPISLERLIERIERLCPETGAVA